MNTPTYQEQWQKITSAYLNNELNPWRNCACFVGNLLQKRSDWAFCRSELGVLTQDEIYRNIGIKYINMLSGDLYSAQEIIALELNFLQVIDAGTENKGKLGFAISSDFSLKQEHPNYENALFEAMVSTLEMLRQIHISKGEDVDSIELKKRELATV